MEKKMETEVGWAEAIKTDLQPDPKLGFGV